MKPRVSTLLPWAVAGLVWAVLSGSSVCHAADDPASSRKALPDRGTIWVRNLDNKGIENVKVLLHYWSSRNRPEFKTDAEGKVEIRDRSDGISVIFHGISMNIFTSELAWPGEFTLSTHQTRIGDHPTGDAAANKSMQGPQKLDLRVLDHQRKGVANVEVRIESTTSNPVVFRTDAEGRVKLNAEFGASDTICFSACAVRVAIGIKAVDWPCEIILPKTRPLRER